MGSKINTFFILLTIFTTASATIGLLLEWSDYKRTYGKNYNIFEDVYRKTIFLSNANQIKLHNLRFSRGCETYDLGINQFTDMTYAEFANIFQETSTILPQGSPYPPKGLCNNVKDNATPWRNFDWRVFGGDTPVKDQGITCNTGWAFAALSALEGRTFAATQSLPESLSAQNLIDCIAPQTCTSKTPIDAYNYIIREQNVNTEIWYPYVGKPGSCKYLSTNLGATCANYVTELGGENEIRILKMKFFVVLLCISAAICVYATDVEKEWAEFKVKFDRNYSPEEEVKRKEIFAEHLRHVDEHNKKFEEKTVSYSIGINQFSDLTEDERKKLHGGVILPNAVKDAVDE